MAEEQARPDTDTIYFFSGSRSVFSWKEEEEEEEKRGRRNEQIIFDMKWQSGVLNLRDSNLLTYCLCDTT